MLYISLLLLLLLTLLAIVNSHCSPCHAETVTAQDKVLARKKTKFVFTALTIHYVYELQKQACHVSHVTQ